MSPPNTAASRQTFPILIPVLMPSTLPYQRLDYVSVLIYDPPPPPPLPLPRGSALVPRTGTPVAYSRIQRSIAGALKWSGLASSTTSWERRQAENMNGPEPTGTSSW